MATSIGPYLAEHEPLVRDFNARMAALGTHWIFYDKAIPEWLPRTEGAQVWRDYYLAVDDTPAMRGAYCLKQQRFLLNGQPFAAASIQGPISEGVVDPKFGTLGLHLIRDMQQREQNLFAWGASDKLIGVLRKMRWTEIQTPIALHVLRPARFLRMNRFLRANKKVALVSDLLAMTGAAAIALPLIQFAQRVAAGGLGGRPAKATEEARFGPWADEIWAAAKGHYDFVAERDSASMNTLLPAGSWPQVTILKVERDGVPIGWAAARAANLKDNGRFGDLRVGTIIDCLAVPGEEDAVVRAATAHLRKQKVDVIFGNFSSPVWTQALKRTGYLVSQNRRLLIISPPFAETLGAGAKNLHLTLLDGDGPLGL